MANQLLIKNTMTDMRALSAGEITGLTNGTYSGVQLLGYYQAGDTPNPINYYLSSTTDPDDGGSVIVAGTIKLKYDFGGFIDCRYYGIMDDGGVSDQTLKFINMTALTRKNQWKATKVYLPKGNYLLKDNLILGESVEFYGDGMFATTLKFERGRVSQGFLSKNVFLFQNFKNIEIHDIGVHGGTSNYDEVNWDVQGAYNGFYIKALSDYSVENIHIHDCYITKVWSSGLGSYGAYGDGEPHFAARNIKFTNNIVENIGVHGVGLNDIKGIKIYDNLFTNVGLLRPTTTDTTGFGSGLGGDISAGCEDAIVQNNIVDGAAGGFKCETHTYGDRIVYSKNITFSGNVIRNLYQNPAGSTFFNQWYGIKLSGLNTKAVGNTIEGATGYGIVVTKESVRFSVSDNVISNVKNRDSISIANANLGYVKNNLIDKNETSRGISILGNNIKVISNQISNCKLDGIRVFKGDNLTIFDNDCFDNENFGIVISRIDAESKIRNVSLSLNRCYDTRLNENRTQLRGIYVENQNSFNIKSIGNQCFNSLVSNYSFQGNREQNTDIANENDAAKATTAPLNGTWVRGDFIENSNRNILSSGAILDGWICTSGGNPGTWIAVYQNQYPLTRAAASANDALAIGTSYNQLEVQSIVNELRDLKSKMRSAGLLSI